MFQPTPNLSKICPKAVFASKFTIKTAKWGRKQPNLATRFVAHLAYFHCHKYALFQTTLCHLFRIHNNLNKEICFYISSIIRKTLQKHNFHMTVLSARSSFYSGVMLILFFFSMFQELSKIAMPVEFNEPLSFLQRISEYMEHTHLIHKACSLSDSVDRMQVRLRWSLKVVFFYNFL